MIKNPKCQEANHLAGTFGLQHQRRKPLGREASSTCSSLHARHPKTTKMDSRGGYHLAKNSGNFG